MSKLIILVALLIATSCADSAYTAVHHEQDDRRVSRKINYLLSEQTNAAIPREHIIIGVGHNQRNANLFSASFVVRRFKKRLTALLQALHTEDNDQHSLTWQRTIIQSLIELSAFFDDIKSIGKPVTLSFLDFLDARTKPVVVEANGYAYCFTKTGRLVRITIFASI